VGSRWNVNSHCDRLILTPRDTPDFAFKDIPVSFVLKELSSLCVNKSSGLKDIHSRILKVGSNVLAAPRTHTLIYQSAVVKYQGHGKQLLLLRFTRVDHIVIQIILDRFLSYQLL